MSAVGACLGRHIGSQQHLVVALSGGADSMVLLHAVRTLGYAAAAVHVNHGLNPAAEAWEQLCLEACARWHVPLSIARVDVERGAPDGLEAAARRARHGVFATVHADWIVLGHHQGDRAETVLFNLVRGSGVRGAGALGERRDRLLRPLLPVGRRDIMAYAYEHDLRWVEDDSNADTSFSRNYIRHRVLQPLRERFPAAEARLAAAAAHFAEAGDLLDALAKEDLHGRPAAFPLDLAAMGTLTEPRARNVLRYVLSVHGAGIPSEARLREALRQLTSAGADRHPVIRFGPWLLRRRSHHITLERAPES